MDTNVWLAGLFKPRSEIASRTVIEEIKSGRLRLCVSGAISGELTTTAIKFGTCEGGLEPAIRELFWALCRGFVRCEPTVKLYACAAHPDDNKFIDCAREANATIISKNLHLLDLDGEIASRSGVPIKIVTPEDFIADLMKERIATRF